MTTKIKSKAALNQVRTQHSEEFKQQAVMRVAQDGVGVVAKDLGLAGKSALRVACQSSAVRSDERAAAA